MAHSFKQAMKAGRTFLEDGGYSESSKSIYRKEWLRFESFCQDRGLGADVTHEALELYLEENGLTGRGLSAWKRHRARCALVLICLANGDAPPRRYAPTSSPVPDAFVEAYRGYERQLQERGLRERTVYDKLFVVRWLLISLSDLGVESLPGITPESIQGYAAGLAGYASTTRSEWLYTVREFVRYLADECGCDPNLRLLFPVIRYNRYTVLPSGFSTDELSGILGESAGGRCPLMQRAVILLGMVLGMRTGDIRSLRIDSIDWRNSRLSLVQGKTGGTLVLPLPEECLAALADYMRNERPRVDSPYVFVRSRAPFEPLASNNELYYVMQRCIVGAEIAVDGRHHGMHALRHSAAMGMIEGNAPYATVAGVLGHRSANTTLRYVRADVESLRPLSLEVPL